MVSIRDYDWDEDYDNIDEYIDDVSFTMTEPKTSVVNSGDYVNVETLGSVQPDLKNKFL